MQPLIVTSHGLARLNKAVHHSRMAHDMTYEALEVYIGPAAHHGVTDHPSWAYAHVPNDKDMTRAIETSTSAIPISRFSTSW